LQVLAVVSESGKPVSEVCNQFEPMPQVLKNVRFKKGHPLDDQKVIKVIDESKCKLGKTGRLVIRPSGTEPVIRVMAEGDDAKLIGKVVNDIVDALKVAAA
jgi:phosphoglucosamine mutase